MLTSYKQSFAELLHTAIPTLTMSAIFSCIETPPSTVNADFAFPCFALAKDMQKAPPLIAQDLALQLQAATTQRTITAMGPYINASIGIEDLASAVLTKIHEEKETYGQGPAKNKAILIEGRQPNTHKDFHIGHVRNAVIPEALARILAFAGYTVHRCAYMGDVGAHIAKWMRYFSTFHDGAIPETGVASRAGKIYATASKKIDENPDQYKQDIHIMHKRLEDGDPALMEVRKKTSERCLADMQSYFKELDCDIGRLYLESEVEQPGIAKIKEMEQRGIATYSEGAIIMDLEAYNLGICVLLKSNGASLYATKDIAFAYLKAQEFEFDIGINVVATEQTHYFQQLFKVLELEGFEHAKKFAHLSYGMVDLVGEKMSSRKGNVVTYTELRDIMIAAATDAIKTREIPDDQKEAIAHAVAFGAIKFSMLLPDTDRKILFDPQKAVSFDGETGPYIQYTHARCCSILKKSSVSPITFPLFSGPGIFGPIEKPLLMKLAAFPEIVAQAAVEYKPNYIARFLFDLAQTFNAYYQQQKILTENKDETNARVSLTSCVQQVITNGCTLLGIEAPTSM